LLFLNASSGAAHSNIFVLIEILLGTQSKIYVSLLSSELSETAEQKKEIFL